MACWSASRVPHRSALSVGTAADGLEVSVGPWLEVSVGPWLEVSVGPWLEVSVGPVGDSVVSVVSVDSVLVVEEFEVVVPGVRLGHGAGEFVWVAWALVAPAGPASRVVTIAKAQSPAMAGLP